MSYGELESSIYAPVVLNLFINKLRKGNKMLGQPRILSLFPNLFNNFIIHEHSCKFFYFRRKFVSYIWASTGENLSSGVYKQQRCRPACSSAQSDQPLCYSLIRKYHI